jgi:lipopolysaccharide/colanic/teichoic acid biosynthesis glycosyltransferase
MSKRIFDVVFSAIGLVVLMPVYLVCALAIALDSRGPILFNQKRIGRNGKPFLIRKFRTMRLNAESEGALTVGQDRRITRIGHKLRKWKLDELPQLWNVLVGEMSLVGPRPEVPKYVELYTPEQRKILSVKPGMTDLASLNFLDENRILARAKNPEETYIQVIMPIKLSLHEAYLQHAGVPYDIWIILQTLVKIASRRKRAQPLPKLPQMDETIYQELCNPDPSA